MTDTTTPASTEQAPAEETKVDTTLGQYGVDVEDESLESEAEAPSPTDQPPVGETPAAESDDEEESDADSAPSSGKKGGFQRKIDKLAEENEKLRRQLQTVVGAPIATGEVGEKPKVDAFDDYDSYLEALAEWHLDTKTKQQAAEYREHFVRQEQEAQLTKFKAASAEFHKEAPDYLDVLKSVDDIQVPSAVQQMLLAVDNGPALMYELAKNRDKFATMLKQPAMIMAMQIGAMSAELKQRKSTPNVTKAQPPLKPLGTSNPSTGKNPDDMSMAEFKAWRAANPN